MYDLFDLFHKYNWTKRMRDFFIITVLNFYSLHQTMYDTGCLKITQLDSLYSTALTHCTILFVLSEIVGVH